MAKLTKLHELLLTHMDKSARKGYVQKPDVDQAEAAINEYIAEIIGEDAKPDTDIVGCPECGGWQAYNWAKAEQRKRAGITGSGK